ncbi:hypothetical protein G9A89_014945 [Geosiphon pyriformis]|nr:hypothetical protein G9A89_014945 [Geosiphon pyriformis]
MLPTLIRISARILADPITPNQTPRLGSGGCEYILSIGMNTIIPSSQSFNLHLPSLVRFTPASRTSTLLLMELGANRFWLFRLIPPIHEIEIQALNNETQFNLTSQPTGVRQDADSPRVIETSSLITTCCVVDMSVDSFTTKVADYCEIKKLFCLPFNGLMLGFLHRMGTSSIDACEDHLIRIFVSPKRS